MEHAKLVEQDNLWGANGSSLFNPSEIKIRSNCLTVIWQQSSDNKYTRVELTNEMKISIILLKLRSFYRQIEFEATTLKKSISAVTFNPATFKKHQTYRCCTNVHQTEGKLHRIIKTHQGAHFTYYFPPQHIIPYLFVQHSPTNVGTIIIYQQCVEMGFIVFRIIYF